MPRGTYYIPMDRVAVTAAQDLFSLLPATDKPVNILEVFIAQSSDAGDAQDEQLAVRFRRGMTTAGSGGSSVTPSLSDSNDSATGATCRINDTTAASAGTIVDLPMEAFNVRGGYAYRPLPKTVVRVQPGVRWACNLPVAPADSLTVSGYVAYEEL